jgi:hypothetical protein
MASVAEALDAGSPGKAPKNAENAQARPARRSDLTHDTIEPQTLNSVTQHKADGTRRFPLSSALALVTKTCSEQAPSLRRFG